MSWDLTSILLDGQSVKGVIRLQTDALDISFCDWNTVPNLFPKNLECTSQRMGLLECTYNSENAGDFSIDVGMKYCCANKSPYCCTQKGGFNIDCPDSSHILFQKMVSQPCRSECETPPIAGGFPVCTTTAISTCYKACGSINCVSTCSIGNATARCVAGVENPVPKCPATCGTSKDCDAPSCFSNEGKCGSGDFWQSDGDLENLSKGWVMCEFYYDFDAYDRSKQQNLARWMKDLFKYDEDPSKTSPPPDFSIPLLLRALAFQTSLLFFTEIYSITLSPFSTVAYLSESQATKTYVTNILAPIMLSLQQSPVSNLTNLTSLKSILSNEMKLPQFLASTQTMVMRVNPDQYQQVMSSSSIEDGSDILLSSFLNNFLCENETSFYQIPSDGIGSSKSLLISPTILKNTRIQSILTIDISPSVVKSNETGFLARLIRLVNTTTSFISTIRVYDYSERFSIPSTSFIFAYDIASTVDRYSPMLAAYISSFASPPPDVCRKMFSDCGMYPYTYALTSLSDQERDEECRKQIRNDRISGTVNVMGRLLYGYYSPDCKCIISNIAPVGQPQFHNTTSMCFDYNCNSPEMVRRYGLTTTECGSDEKCATIQGWGDQIQNSQTFEKEKYQEVCQQSTPKFPINRVVLVLGTALALITGLLMNRRDARSRIWKTSIVFGSVLAVLSVSLFVAIESHGVPVCKQRNDGTMYTQCTTQITGLSIPRLYCGERHKWCECMFNSGECVCKSGILVPSSGDVQIEKSVDSAWNAVYGMYVVAILLGIVILCFRHIRPRNVVFWMIVTILLMLVIVSQFLCMSTFYNYKNNSDCAGINK